MSKENIQEQILNKAQIMADKKKQEKTSSKEKAKNISLNFKKKQKEMRQALFNPNREVEINDTEETQSNKTNAQQQTATKEEETLKSSLAKSMAKNISHELMSVYEENTKSILMATERAVKAGFIISNTSTSKKEDNQMLIKALDIFINEKLEKASQGFSNAHKLKFMESKEHKRRDFDEMFKEYARTVYTAKNISDNQIPLETENIIDINELKMLYHRSDGVLTLPLHYQNVLLNALRNEEKLTGEQQRGVKAYASFVENLAVINIFREDIFDVF